MGLTTRHIQPQVWLDFKGKITAAGKTQEDIAGLVDATRKAVRRAVMGDGCPRVRARLIAKKLIKKPRRGEGAVAA